MHGSPGSGDVDPNPDDMKMAKKIHNKSTVIEIPAPDPELH
jgi:hypothetical protein